MGHSVHETIGNSAWVLQNFKRLRDLFPSKRTLVNQAFVSWLGSEFKKAGIDWQHQREVTQVMVQCHHLKMFEQEFQHGCIFIQRGEAQLPPPKFFGMSSAEIHVNRILRTTPPAEIQDLAAELLHSIMYPQS